MKKMVTGIIVVCLLAGITGCGVLNLPGAGAVYEEFATISVNSDEVSSRYALVIDAQDETVLYERNKNEQCYPASMTKIMTAIIAIESVEDLYREVMIDSAAYNTAQAEKASVAGFLPGEYVRIIDLLYGIMLPSGAECSLTIAGHIAGSEEAYVQQMNAKAEALGMNGTNFVNVTGLHDKNHYSTVEDISTLLLYCLKNQTFREIFTSFSHVVPETNLHPGGVTLYSTLTQQTDDFTAGAGVLIGGKSGYTKAAGLCLASMGSSGGKEYIIVTAGAPGSARTHPSHIEDALYLYERAFSQM